MIFCLFVVIVSYINNKTMVFFKELAQFLMAMLFDSDSVSDTDTDPDPDSDPDSDSVSISVSVPVSVPDHDPNSVYDFVPNSF